jgi:membrane-associated protease RseP (regulator of RpoE activity)
MQTFVTILILILMLGILISAHEAGHLFMAKRFNVYCSEYSIGFGPKLFSHRRKGGETAFSIRAIPLGGYVSMYGEGVELEEGVNVPPERSLEGVAAWKRCLIFIAGIVVNIFLSFIFVLIYATSFPSVQTYQVFETNLKSQDETIQVAGFFSKGSDTFSISDSERLYSPAYIVNDAKTKAGFIIDTEAILTHNSIKQNVVVLYYPSSLEGPNDLYSSCTVYEQGTQVKNANTLALGVTYLPSWDKNIEVLLGDTLELHVSFMDESDTSSSTAPYLNKRSAVLNAAMGENSKWTSDGVATYGNDYWAPFGERLKTGCEQWASFFSMIGAGLVSLFSFNMNAIGGIVAAGASISQFSSFMGVGKTFFYYGGFLSLNLAIFNLLPFPGLDGWAILVTLIEKIFRKKVPTKVKNIVSNVGLVLLLLLAIFITVKDIMTYLV